MSARLVTQPPSSLGPRTAREGVGALASFALYLLCLALCALASEKDSLSYAEVAAGLDVEVGAVEEWIVQAISEDLLEARLDQLEQVVVVQSVSFRTFGDDQWKVLQQRLKEWKDNVKAVVDTLRAAQGKQ